ncbi:serine protease 3-like [Chironomus tepperi]|uniref:serine protease 3-like n=1 Tax=Chironomus tepperi TaxID=113505 RepID=UPI00391F892B
MKYCFYLILLSLFCLTSAESAHETRTLQLTNPDDVEDFVFKGKKSNSKTLKLQIANGKQATDTQFPYAAELAINTANGGYLCTGSWIGSNWILTARHCAADIPVQSVLASFGSADRQGQRVQIYVDNLIWMNSADGKHPDIALFHLSQVPPTTAFIKPIRLPSIPMEDFGYEGNEFAAIGWGQVSPGMFSRYLQYTYFKILTKASCNLGQYLICSQPPTGTSQLLGGDSGGPGVIVEADGIETLIGVNVAYVTSGTTIWQASTRVSSFLKWIQTQTGIANNPDSLIPTPAGGAACLTPGQMLKSKSGCFILVFQGDGNVVIYPKSGFPQAGTAVWNTKTAGKTATAFCMQGDGNLVLYNGNTALWNSGTQNNPGAYVVLQGDANLVVYKAGTTPNPQNALWWSGGLSIYPGKC